MYKKLYLKITTVPNQLGNFNPESKEIEIFRSKYEAHKGFISETDTEVTYLNEAATNGSFSRLYSITLGFIHEDTIVSKTLIGEEKNLLEKLVEIISKKDDDGNDFRDATLVMYNRSFVLPFLSKRFRKHGINISLLPVCLNAYDKKPWTIKGSKCLQEFVKGISYQTENFEESCMIHDIDCDIIEPSLVSRIVRNEKDLDQISDSDTRYMKALIELDRQLSEESALDNFKGMVDNIGKVKKEPVNVLEHILASGQLSKTVIDAIVDKTKKDKLDPKNVLTLVSAAISNKNEKSKAIEEDVQPLKEALGLQVDYSTIECVVEKGNLGKKEAEVLIKLYKKETKRVKEKVLSLLEEFLTEKGKINQARTKGAMEFLKENL